MSRVLVIGILVVILMTFLTTSLYPDNMAFSAYNTGYSGTSCLLRYFGNYSESNITLLLLVTNYNVNLSNYVRYGNTLIIAGNESLVNYYMTKVLKVPLILGDELINGKNYYYLTGPILLVKDGSLLFVFPYVHPVIGGNSLMSYNNQSIISLLEYGKGKIILIGTPLIFLNKYYDLQNNTILLKLLLGSHPTIIISRPTYPIDEFKELLSTLLLSDKIR